MDDLISIYSDTSSRATPNPEMVAIHEDLSEALKYIRMQRETSPPQNKSPNISPPKHLLNDDFKNMVTFHH